MIRVIIAEDHKQVRQGIKVLLEKADDIEVIGQVRDGQEAVKLVERLAPDVVVMDIVMPHLNGIKASEQVCKLGLGTQVVILSMYSDETLVQEALRSGARGYVLKSSSAQELVTAVRVARRGETYLSPAIAEMARAGFTAS